MPPKGCAGCSASATAQQLLPEVGSTLSLLLLNSALQSSEALRSSSCHANMAACLSASHMRHGGGLVLTLGRRPRLAGTIHDATVGLLHDSARQRYSLQHCVHLGV